MVVRSLQMNRFSSPTEFQQSSALVATESPSILLHNRRIAAAAEPSLLPLLGLNPNWVPLRLSITVPPWYRSLLSPDLCPLESSHHAVVPYRCRNADSLLSSPRSLTREMAPSWSASSHPPKNVKFYNKHCSCGYKCSVKIYESKDNPNRLYFCCQSKNKCGFFEWWEAPEDLHDNRGMGAECTGVSYFEKNVDDKWKDVTNELKILNMKMNGLVIFCVCLLFVVLLK